MPELETVDLEGVEILSTGGPVHAIGSPPSGDYWTREQLRSMVEAARELEGELDAPARIGHRRMGESAEEALRSSPAVGWLTNHRLSEDGARYLADVKRVPRRFAELIRAGAWRKRSAELSKITSQKTGKTYDYVVTGLAWLGDRLPAVRTLDDVVALYEGEGAERRLLVEYDNAEAPKTVDEVIEIALRAAAAEHDPGSPKPPADTRPMKFSEEQRRKFAEATGLEADKVTDDMLAGAGVAPDQAAPVVSDEQAKAIASALGVEGDEITAEKLLEAAKAAAEGEGGDDEGDGGGDEAVKALERRLEAAERQAQKTAEELRVERRNAFVEGEIKAGKIAPGAREKLERLYDKDPEGAREFVSELKPDEELLREHGSDDEPDLTEEQERAYVADASQRLGIPEKELV